MKTKKFVTVYVEFNTVPGTLWKPEKRQPHHGRMARKVGVEQLYMIYCYDHHHHY